MKKRVKTRKLTYKRISATKMINWKYKKFILYIRSVEKLKSGRRDFKVLISLAIMVRLLFREKGK